MTGRDSVNMYIKPQPIELITETISTIGSVKNSMIGRITATCKKVLKSGVWSGLLTKKSVDPVFFVNNLALRSRRQLGRLSRIKKSTIVVAPVTIAAMWKIHLLYIKSQLFQPRRII